MFRWFGIDDEAMDDLHRHLIPSVIDRYLINSAMLPNLTEDPDGGITIQVQNESPGPGKEANWLPAPDGPFQMILPPWASTAAALNGTWKAPQALRGSLAGWPCRGRV